MYDEIYSILSNTGLYDSMFGELGLQLLCTLMVLGIVLFPFIIVYFIILRCIR